MQLSVPSVRLSPTLEDVQTSINAAAASVLGCAKRLFDWGEADVPEADRFSFFEALGSDLEIIKTVLLLTGASYGTAVQASFVVHWFVGMVDLSWAGRLSHQRPMKSGLKTLRQVKSGVERKTPFLRVFRNLDVAKIVLLDTGASDAIAIFRLRIVLVVVEARRVGAIIVGTPWLQGCW